VLWTPAPRFKTWYSFTPYVAAAEQFSTVQADQNVESLMARPILLASGQKLNEDGSFGCDRA